MCNMNCTHMVLTSSNKAVSDVNKCNHMNIKSYFFGMKVTIVCLLIKLNEAVTSWLLLGVA